MKIQKTLFFAVTLALPAALFAQPKSVPLPGDQPAAQAAPARQPEADFTGNIFAVKGDVTYQKAGASDWLPVKAPQLINEGDKVRTAAKARAEIYIRHGVKVRIEAGSTFVLNSAAKDNGSMEVLVGKMQAWIRKLSGRKLSVRTPTAVCAIRGTVVEVEVAESGETAWNLFSGNIVVSDAASNNPVAVAPNQRVVVTRNAGVTAPVPLPAEIRVPSEPAKTKEEKEEIKAEQQAARLEQKAASDKAKEEGKARAEAEAKAKAEADAKAKADAEAKAKADEKAAAPVTEEPPVITVVKPEATVIETQEVQESCEVSGSTPGCN